MFTRVARLTYTHPKWVLAGTVAFVAIAIAAGGSVADRLKPAGLHRPGLRERERRRARPPQMLGHDPSPGSSVVARAPGGDISAPAARAEIQRLARVVAADPRWRPCGLRSSRGSRASSSRATAARR